MSQPGSYLTRSAKAEPLSPFSDDDKYWLIDDDSVFNGDIFTSLPLSLIQQDKDASSSSPLSNIEQYIVPDSPVPVKYEDLTSPPYSPAPSSPEPLSRAELAARLLSQLEDCKEEPPFSDWLEEKIDLPIFEEFPAPCEPLQDTQSLLLEFESVCGAVGLRQFTPLAHLTPPQSPPRPYPAHVPSWSQAYQQVSSPLDIARELAAVDELVQHRARDIPCHRELPALSPASDSDNSASFFPSYPHDESPQKGSAAVPVSAIAPEIADAQYAQSYYCDLNQRSEDLVDPRSPNSSSSSSVCGSSENDDEWAPASSGSSPDRPRVRTKPYSRNPDDKRSRKKEQNKNAATRYRQKKKAEVEVLVGEEKELQDKNGVLAERCADLSREIRYLKGLMRDVCRAKGLIK